MADSFKFELVSPQRLLISANVSEVIVPGSEGDFTVLPDHAPVIAMLRPGILRVPGMDGGTEIYVRGGIADVGAGGAVTVLAEHALPIAEVNRDFLAQEIKDVETDLADAKDPGAKLRAAETLQQLEYLRDTLHLAA